MNSGRMAIFGIEGRIDQRLDRRPDRAEQSHCQTDDDTGHGANDIADRDALQADRQIRPQLAAGDHASRFGEDRRRRREEPGVDPADPRAELPEPQQKERRQDRDAALGVLAAEPRRSAILLLGIEIDGGAAAHGFLYSARCSGMARAATTSSRSCSQMRPNTWP